MAVCCSWIHLPIILLSISFIPTTLATCCDCRTAYDSFSGITGCSADSTCQQEVCKIDHYCCHTAWDNTCARYATDICNATNTNTGPCCGSCVLTGFFNQTRIGCANDQCQSQVCAQNDYCCGNGCTDSVCWNQGCADQATQICLNPPTTTHPTSNPLPVSIRQNVSCGSFIDDSLSFADEKHYYLFVNEHDNLPVTIDTIPPGYISTFDTDLTLYDAQLNRLIYVDGNSINNYKAILSTTLNAGTYIIMLDDYFNTTIGQYYIRITCDLPPTPNPTANPTTSDPTTSNPTTSNPTTSNPTTSNPTTSDPTTSHPTTPYPTTANPTQSPLAKTTSEPTTTPEPTTFNIKQNVSCGSFINDYLSIPGEKHYYLFRNKYEDLDITISTIPDGYYSTFDTDLTVYNSTFDEIAYVDGESNNGYRAILSATWSAGIYIIMLEDWYSNDYNATYGQYFLEFDCHLPTTPSPISYFTTTDGPTIDVSTTFDVSLQTSTTDMVSSATSLDTSATGMHQHSNYYSHVGLHWLISFQYSKHRVTDNDFRSNKSSNKTSNKCSSSYIDRSYNQR